MKTRLYLLAVGATALALNISTSFGQVFSPQDATNNRAIAASPRAKEAFPWLTRTPSVRADACCDQGEVRNALTEATRNRAYASSPRVLELFPELGLTPTRTTEFTIATLVEKNEALKSSPHYREQHPDVLRVTPAGTAKCGASKHLEFGK